MNFSAEAALAFFACLVLSVVVAALANRRGHRFYLALLILVGAAAGSYALHSGRDLQISERAELQKSIFDKTPGHRADKFESSATCRKCHPGEYASWHQTFHRTMTQRALPGNVMGDFDGSTISSDGLEYRVFRRGEEFWAEMPNPDMMLHYARSNGRTSYSLFDIPRVERQVVMTTGSHHYQTYWVPSEEFEGVLETLPLIYLPKKKRWIPREAAFMMPPEEDVRMITIWNDHCINCHSTGGIPGVQRPTPDHPHGTFATQVGELGISCESCHGPAKEHADQQLNLLTRYSSRWSGDSESDADDLAIQNPATLDHKQSSQVCGQCHGVFIRGREQAMDYAQHGIQFKPGDELSNFRKYIEFPNEDSTVEVQKQFHKNREFYRERWWDDGTMLAGGREYTALLDVGCYTHGEMSCLSCHSMHDADPEAQVKQGMDSSDACTQCHTEPRFTTDVQSHTHHLPASTGSDCLNCHMPHVSYALFRAVRTHSIDSPRIANSINHGTPNACNLCHLDQTLAWSQSTMAEWYGHEELELGDDEKNISAAVLWLLKGHAAQRVIAAWHFGWKPAQETSRSDWMPPLLGQLLADPYGVVRYVAQASLEAIESETSTADLDDYDFLGTEAHWTERVARVLDSWNKTSAASISSGGLTPAELKALLLLPSGSLDNEELQRVIGLRDDRPVEIRE